MSHFTASNNARPRFNGRCKFCREHDLRRSRFRMGDMWHLLALQWPTRCLLCSKRQHIFVWQARNAVSSRAAHAGEFSTRETWQGYTTGAKPVRSVAHEALQDEDAA